MARSTKPGDWMTHLPLVLLGLRSSIREDGAMSPAELVYGSALRLPGELLPDPDPSSSSSRVPQSDFLRNLQDSLRQALPLPITHHGRRSVQVPKLLESASFVYVRVDAVRPPLVRPYEGPYKVVARDPKTFKLMKNGRPWIVSIDRLRPAVLQSPTVHAPLRPSVLSPSAPRFIPGTGRPATPSGPVPARLDSSADDDDDPGDFGAAWDGLDDSVAPALPDLPPLPAAAVAPAPVAVPAPPGDLRPAPPSPEAAPAVTTRSGRISRPPDRYGF